MKKKDILFLKETLKEQKQIAILIHYNPDGDAIGAALALSEYFTSKKHKVAIVSPNSFPDFLQWMKGADKIIIATEDSDSATKKIKTADLIFCVDFNAANRIGLLENALIDASGIKILIDHHVAPANIFDIYYSVTAVSSTSELIYNFLFKKLDTTACLTKTIAEHLYVGIITDTNSLRNSCNNYSTYTIIGKLVKTGINAEQIQQKIYNNYSESRMRLLGHCLLNRFHVLYDYATSYIYLTQEDLMRFSYKQGDTEGFVNFGLTIKNIDFTAFFVERKDRIRVSFRSKNNFDVNEYARKYFNGGGHKNAAGADSFMSMDETLEYFISTLKECKIRK